MDNYCIIAGGGKLPLIIRKELIKSGKNVFLIGIKNNFKYKNINNSFVLNLGSLGKILRILNENNIKKLIFAGSIKRPSINDLSIDFAAFKFINNNRLDQLGDDSLLKLISEYFKKQGYEFIKWYNYCPNLFINENQITKTMPSEIAIENLNKGLKIFKFFGKSDVGQSIIVQNKMILGLEAIEGTDLLIKRCSSYKRKGDKGILIKLLKKNQDIRFDLPTIGINTIKLLKKYNYEGIFLQKKFSLILDKEKVIKYANINKIFISGI